MNKIIAITLLLLTILMICFSGCISSKEETSIQSIPGTPAHPQVTVNETQTATPQSNTSATVELMNVSTLNRTEVKKEDMKNIQTDVSNMGGAVEAKGIMAYL